MSLDKLARMVQTGFDETQEGFKEVNKRLDRIEQTLLKNHEQRIKRLEEALNL